MSCEQPLDYTPPQKLHATLQKAQAWHVALRSCFWLHECSCNLRAGQRDYGPAPCYTLEVEYGWQMSLAVTLVTCNSPFSSLTGGVILSEFRGLCSSLWILCLAIISRYGQSLSTRYWLGNLAKVWPSFLTRGTTVPKGIFSFGHPTIGKPPQTPKNK